MVDVGLAKIANKELHKLKDNYFHVSYDYMKKEPIFDTVTGNVIYVGCGTELSSLFLFENANQFTHQDITDHNLELALNALSKKGIISELNPLYEDTYKREFNFKYKDKVKTFIEVHGGTKKCDVYGSNGDIAVNVPCKEELGAIYFFGMPYPDSIKAVQLNLLPLLKIGGVFQGPYPYFDGRFEGAPPNELGLKKDGETFVKEKHLTKDEIQTIIGYSIEDYLARIWSPIRWV